MKTVYSVGQVNRYVKNMFIQDYVLRKVYVKGEVSNCKYHTSGHIYFSLKDETGVLSCVMFAGQRRGLAFRMKDGDRVVVGGAVDVYERDGRYQMYAKEITLEGAGALYERFLALKAELEEMGMFAPEYKQPIPRFIRRLGVVTAPTGAAVQDIRNISLRRNPYLQIILYPALVQGDGAADSIVKGIRMLDEAGVDTIIVGRGGGSIEDLWAFNEEKVARAIFECRTPIISAVGHEVDFTIADFVADLRAPTPSAAAELAVDDMAQVMYTLSSYQERFQRDMREEIEFQRVRLGQYQMRLKYLSPESRLRDRRQALVDFEDTLRRAMDNKLQQYRHRLGIYLERYQGLSPLAKLNQGYSFVADSDELYDLLSEHKFDIGFVYQHLHYKNIIAEQIFEEKLYLVQSEHPVIPRAQVHTDELDSSMELFLSWDDNFQIWHDRWLSSVTRPHISADTITLLDRLWKKDENWMIAPESVIQELSHYRSLYVSELVNTPPNRVCYKIRHRYPKVSNKLAVEYFEHELERFLEKRHLHIPVGVVWHS